MRLRFNLHADNDDPPGVRNWGVHLIAVVVSMGSLAMGYDTAVIGGTMALDSFKRDFGLNSGSQHWRDILQGNIVSTFQAGTFFGALLTFAISEKFGRKKAIMLAVAVFLIGGTLMTCSNGHLPLVYAGRAIAGFGIGSVSLLVPVYIAETSPPSIRGRLVGIFEILSQAGGIFCRELYSFVVYSGVPRLRDVEKVGRPRGLIWGAFIGSIPMWYLGGYVLKTDPTGAAARGDVARSGWGYLAMVCVYLYGLIYCATWQGITWVYYSEIFPLDIRMLCVAITTVDQWFWSFIVSRTTPHMITSLGYEFGAGRQKGEPYEEGVNGHDHDVGGKPASEHIENPDVLEK
ncbi:hypothetical protein TWF217_003770 [Orbilia oligospora]|nr:hypothetical protein TWF217_003770 [Orbilia oligospora]